MAPKLEGKVALVADATRGAGRGIAVDLGAAGPTVYATGRSGMEAGPGGQPDIARKPPGYGAPGGFYITPLADRV